MRTRKSLPGTLEPRHVWAGFGGIRLAGDSWGDPKSPLVLLMHGLGQTRHAWRLAGKVLSESGYHAVAFDARGHGDSDWASDGNYSWNVMIQDLKCLITALGGGRVALIGASMGGSTGLVAIGDGHVDASALILVDVAPRLESNGIARIKTFMRESVHGFDTLERVARAIHKYKDSQERPRGIESLAGNVRLGGDGKYYWHWDPLLLERIPPTNERRAESARRLTLPTLLVRGARSDVVSEEGARDFLALCPHAEYVNVVGAGHMVAGDRNDAFAQAAAAFLKRAVPTQMDREAESRPTVP